jgi:hypothetical protein
MGRGGRARPRRRLLYEVYVNEPVDPNNEDWWWLDGLPMPDEIPLEDVTVEDEAPPEDVPVEDETPPENVPVEAETPHEEDPAKAETPPVAVDLEDFLATHTATDEQVALLNQFIMGAGDPATIWANLLASMMASFSLSVAEDADAD